MWRIENDAPPFLDLLSTTRPARADEALMNRISSLHGFSTLSAIIRLSVFSGFTAQCIVIKHGSCLFFLPGRLFHMLYISTQRLRCVLNIMSSS